MDHHHIYYSTIVTETSEDRVLGREGRLLQYRINYCVCNNSGFIPISGQPTTICKKVVYIDCLKPKMAYQTGLERSRVFVCIRFCM